MDDIQITYLICLSQFELIELLIKIIYSHILINFQCFILMVWTWISLDRNSSLSWSLSTRSIQCHNKPDLFPYCKQTNLVNVYIWGYTHHLKTRVDIWTRMGVVLVDYGMFPHLFILKICFFQIINSITFRWYYVLLCIVVIMVLIIILKNWGYIGFLHTQYTFFFRRTYPFDTETEMAVKE